MCFEIKANGNDNSWRGNTSIPKMGFLRDRWPRFTTVTHAFDVNIEYRIYQDTLYQVYTYKKKNPETQGIPTLPQLTINVKPLFQHLDFSKKPDRIDQNLTRGYVRERNKEENVLRIRAEANGNGNAIAQTAACLCLSLFINGCAQKLSGDDNTTEYTIDPPDPSKLQVNGKIQIALAYTLGQLSSEPHEINDINPKSFTDSWRASEESEVNFKAPSFMGDARLNFSLRRNLEHILSVCSVPVAETSQMIPLVVLTCGDVSGHRISTAASL